LHLRGPKGKFALGRIRELGSRRELFTERSDRDVVRIAIKQVEDLSRGNLRQFLKEHYDASRDPIAK
jgi:hypothetical protein